MINAIKTLALSLFTIGLFFFNTANAAFIISGENSCYSSEIYAYNFSEYSILPELTIKVSEHVLFADITMELVNDPKEADLIFIDGYGDASMKVCKQNYGVSIKTIKVSEYALFPDITVKLSEYAVLPDYKIFIDTKEFTREEVAALFATIWKTNRD